jgi:hypothetical protein
MVAVGVRREVGGRIVQPIEDGEAPRVREALHDERRDRVDSLPFDEIFSQAACS